jgi:hypothetical protein
MVGLFGALFASAQAAVLERGAWAALLATPAGAGGGLAAAAGALAAFTAALFAFSSLVPLALIWGGAAALNLSLLTSDLWAAAARVALFGGFGGGGGWFAAALALVAGGLALYASAGSPKAGASEAEEGAATVGGGGAAAAAWPPGLAADRGGRFQRCASAEPLCGAAAAGAEGGAEEATAAAWARRARQLLSLAGGRSAWALGSGGGSVSDASGPSGGRAASSPECRLLLGRPSLDGMEHPRHGAPAVAPV